MWFYNKSGCFQSIRLTAKLFIKYQVNSRGNKVKVKKVKKGSYTAHLLRWHIEAPLYSERSGTVRVYLGSHSVTCVHTRSSETE